jgi:hypothetical protein
MKKLRADQASFDALVDFLESHGNPVLGTRWRMDKEGLHTFMTLPLDMALVQKHFSADTGVEISATIQRIATLQDWLEITHWPGLRYNPARAGMGDAYDYPPDQFAQSHPQPDQTFASDNSVGALAKPTARNPSMNATAKPTVEKLTATHYICGVLSFIPLLGILFGLIAIIMGFLAKMRAGKWLALVGACGIAFTIALYGSLIYFGFAQRGGMADEMRSNMTQTALYTCVAYIELHRLQHGEYPASIQALRDAMPAGTMINTMDMSIIRLSGPPKDFYYQRSDDGAHYYLRGVGDDDQAFTADDILPTINQSDITKTGLLLQPQRSRS